MIWADLRDVESGKLLGRVSPCGRYLQIRKRDEIYAIVDLRAPAGPRCLSRSERNDLLNGNQPGVNHGIRDEAGAASS